MKRTLLFFCVVGLLGILALPNLALAIDASEGDCAHRISASLPNGEFSGVWITSDPGVLVSASSSYTMSARALVVASSNITITGVPVDNTWSCYFNGGGMSQVRMWELVSPLVPAELVRVDAGGNITHEVVTSETTWTPEPTNTATATASPTSTSTPTPTSTATPTATLWQVFLPAIFNFRYIAPPTATPTADPAYAESNCSQRTTNVVNANAPGGWTTTDSQGFTTMYSSYNLSQPGRFLIVSSSTYTLSTSNNSWSCNYSGVMPQDRQWELLNPPAWLVVIDATGHATFQHYSASNVTSTPAPTSTPPTPPPSPTWTIAP